MINSLAVQDTNFNYNIRFIIKPTKHSPKNCKKVCSGSDNIFQNDTMILSQKIIVSRTEQKRTKLSSQNT